MASLNVNGLGGGKRTDRIPIPHPLLTLSLPAFTSVAADLCDVRLGRVSAQRYGRGIARRGQEKIQFLDLVKYVL
jgi:hypothetical protein